VIIASPLGLRTIIGSLLLITITFKCGPDIFELTVDANVGGEDDRHREYDFLSSIEIAIVDQADVMTMQNWDHMTLLFDCLNKIPTKPRSTDFSRVR